MHASITIGLVNPKSPENVGMVMRAAGCYGAHKVLYTGERFPRARKFSTDTRNIQHKIPLEGVDNLLEAAGQAQIVGVELIEGATPLMDFVHPDRAFYIFGPEDGSLSQAILDACQHVVFIPTNGCLNLAASVNVVLYDRLAKNPGNAVSERSAAQNKDRNSRAVLSPRS